MIINSLADGQVTSNQLVEFTLRPISYSLEGSSGTLTGTVNAGECRNVDASAVGKGPYKVTLGYVNHSYQAQPVSVDDNDALVTFWMAFPAGPNGPQSLVFPLQQ
ncbi:hypothetical protein [Xanthomonas cannabis]|uniref:hypothetical protein n=1 Tax=Xanthomonas cannabis TaxID=1885674 RepID=UPI00141B59C1|nr:hypothetical protein [Xanthomonas cannabis]NIK00646.1 hypothetical protein [Xanthomonas cannabis]